MKKLLLICMVFVCVPSLHADETAKVHLYSTWDTMEVDKCASAWLIKRFIDKEARFTFFSEGTLITEGIPFDTPDSEFRRYHNMSTFESILQRYKIHDPALIEIGKIMHDIEVNFWAEKAQKISERVEREVKEFIMKSTSPPEALQKGHVYFDRLYKELGEVQKEGQRQKK